MKMFTLMVSALALVVGCSSPSRRVPSIHVIQLTKEAREFERADVQTEVEERFRKGDFRFKGWLKTATEDIVFTPGLSEQEGAALREASLSVGEVLYIENLRPFIVGNDMATAWQQRTTALFDYMRRFNRALFDKLVRDGKISKA